MGPINNKETAQLCNKNIAKIESLQYKMLHVQTVDDKSTAKLGFTGRNGELRGGSELSNIFHC